MSDCVISLRERNVGEVAIRLWRSKQQLKRKRVGIMVSKDDLDYVVSSAICNSLSPSSLVVGQLYVPLLYSIDLHQNKLTAKVMFAISKAEYLGRDSNDRSVFKYPSASYKMHFPADQNFGYDDLTEGIAIYNTMDELYAFISAIKIKYASRKDVSIEMMGYDLVIEKLLPVDSIDFT